MASRKIKLELTEREALSLVLLAECASNTYDDAEAALDDSNLRARSQAIAAGYRAIEKLNHALYKKSLV
jgi:hypothetical protein